MKDHSSMSDFDKGRSVSDHPWEDHYILENCIIPDANAVSNANQVFKEIMAYIKERNWETEAEDPNERCVELDFSMGEIVFHILIRANLVPSSISILITLPVICLHEYRLLMKREFNEINTNAFGYFHLDDDGQITNRLVYLLSDEGFEKNVFISYLSSCFTDSVNYFPFIAKTSSGSLTDKERIALKKEIKDLLQVISK